MSNRRQTRLRPSLVSAWLCAMLCGLAFASSVPQRRSIAGPRPSANVELMVAAAAELNPAITDVGHVFEKKTGRHVRLTFADRRSLDSQIRRGVPFDAVFSMDIDHPLRLVASGAAVKATTYARDRIVLCISPMARVDLPPRNPLTVLRNKALAHIAISDPQRTIAGKAALQAMRAAHIYDVTVQRKFLVGDDSSQVAQFVQNGSADVALLPLSAVRAYSLSGTRVISIPASLAPPIRMGAVVMKSSKHSREAQEFIQVAASAEGSAIFSRYGFEAPRSVRTLNRR